MKKVILIPEVSHNIGYGHFKRIENLAKILKKYFKVRIIPYSEKKGLFVSLQKNKFDFSIIDFRYYKKSLIKKLLNLSPAILIDSPKIFNSKNPVLYLNILTPLKCRRISKLQFNYDSLKLLPINLNYFKKISKDSNGLLITFGNTDPNKLTLKVLKSLNRIKSVPLIKIVIGRYFKEHYIIEIKDFLFKKFRHKYFIIEGAKNLYNEIRNSKYVITSFGLTFIEALLFRKIVGLYNNSYYHKKLARRFDGYYLDLGFFPLRVKDLEKFLKLSQFPLKEIELPDNKFLIKIIKNFSEFKKSKYLDKCKICGGKVFLILNQFERQIYECKNCGLKFLELKSKKEARELYKPEYFTEEYRLQYGKTYIEDKDNIMKLAEDRLNIIKKFLKEKGSKILDVGCAYGFFLLKAKENGFIPKGIEIEKKAADYAKKILKLDVINSDFLKAKITEKFDIITMWYVLEHFSEPSLIIEKVVKLLNYKGILALSIPNGNGAFYRFKKLEWLKSHSDHHYFDYTIKSLKIFLKKYGFKLKFKRITGIHPERIGIKNKILKILAGNIFKLLNLGDTMELYFVKEK